MTMQHVNLAIRIPDLRSSEKFVLTVLGHYADQSGQAWPTTLGLASDCCMSQSTVQRVTRGLADKGLVTITHQSGGRRRLTLETDRMEAMVKRSAR